MTDRTPCCVPFCRRSCKGQWSDWICGPHWMAVPARVRRIKYRAFRRYRRRFGDNGWWHYPPGSPDRLEALRLERLCNWAWSLCKKMAIERAAGI